MAHAGFHLRCHADQGKEFYVRGLQVKILTIIGTGVMFLAAAVVLAFVLMGPERVWGLFGEPDLGPVSFEQLQRRSSPNDALACPHDVCKVPVDIKSMLYPVNARELRMAFAKVIASAPRVVTVDANETALTDRYVQRTGRLGFPDTIVVQFFDRPDGQSTLAIYSRSQLGESDLGENKTRIERWLSRLADQVQPVE
ncbi:MAG: DUF1499 domain-containing protein [Anderseniella sp.]